MDMMGKGSAKSQGVGMRMADVAGYRKNVIASGLNSTMNSSANASNDMATARNKKNKERLAKMRMDKKRGAIGYVRV